MGCNNSKIINAPLDKVWAAVRNFHDLGWAKGVIEKCDVIGEAKGDQLGARRKLNDAFVETLLALDDHAHVIKYSIDEGPGPLETASEYVGKIELHPITETNQTLVLWTSTYQDPNGGVKEFCDGVYQAALNAMAGNLG